MSSRSLIKPKEDSFYGRSYDVERTCEMIKEMCVHNVVYSGCKETFRMSRDIDRYINRLVNVVKRTKFARVSRKYWLRCVADKARQCFNSRIYDTATAYLRQGSIKPSIHVIMINNNTGDACSFDLYIDFKQ